jgi:hypothetical protein
MNRLGLLVLSSVALAACGSNSPSGLTSDAATAQAPAFTRSTQPVYTCASADAMVRSLITLVQHATHSQAPVTETVLLAPLNTAHAALVATPCDKQGALDAMRSFNTAVDASTGSLTTTQVLAFHGLANRIIAAISLVQ